MIVSVPGASACWWRFCRIFKSYEGTTTRCWQNNYSQFSVVSQVAQEMATLTRDKTQSDYAIAVTGNAGPSKDNTDKSVGIVYIAIASAHDLVCHEFNFGQPREKVINRTVNKSLQILKTEILKNN